VNDFDMGMQTRREVLGDEHVDRATAAAGSFGLPWQEFITRYAWGGAWSRPGLDRRTRSAITLAALISMRAENEIGMHVRGALRNGLTVEEIAEVFIHTAVYAGVPAANAAFAVARQVFEEEDPHPPRPPAIE
jgi:4-carboxymuconolactone decarboxylase